MNVFGFGGDTSLGGPGRHFPSTCWSRFLADEPATARAATESLARDYWKPVYTYIRLKWSRSNEDAKDLAQDFFVWMMESGFLSKADPARGRFRSFVKTALQHYLSNAERDQKAMKRGGDRKVLALDDPEAPELPRADGRSPEAMLDDAWRDGICDRAVQRLEKQLRADGKELYFAVFRDFHLLGQEEPTYRGLAGRHGIGEKDVENYLAYVRRECRTILTELVADTVGSDADLREELRLLFGSGA